MTKTEKTQLANMILMIGALKTELAALKATPAVQQVTEQPKAEQPKFKPLRDYSLPRYDACNWSRPVVVVCDNDDDAFRLRAEIAAARQSTTAVKAVSAPPGYTVWCVY